MLTRLFAGFVAVLMLALPAFAQPVTLTGTVTYYERIALPAGSQLRLRLVTLADNRQIASATSRIADRASPPVGFTMNLRSTSAASAGPLGLVAEIRTGGDLFFRSAAPTPIDLANPDGIAIVVRRASDPTPVTPPEPALPEPQLLGTSWTVTSIGGRPVSSPRPLTFVIARDSRISGYSGCNSYSAEATITGTTITLGMAVATQMACLSPVMDQEMDYFAALEAVTAYRVEGDSLRLLDAAGVPMIGLVRAPS